MTASSGRRTHAVVDLDAARHNVAAIRRELDPDSDLAAVVKANAYGHGSVEIASAALEAGASVLCVAMSEEAVPLREAGISCPVLVIGPSNAEQMRIGIELGLDLCVFAPDSVEFLEEEAARQNRDAKVHLKVDSGMGRIGVQTAAELDDMLHSLDRASHVDLRGMFTHFARADEYDTPDWSGQQMERFMDAAHRVRSRGYNPRLHVANSAAAQNLPDFDLDMVRFGISLYGYPAGEGHAVRELDLRPVMQVEAEVSAVRDVPKGTPIGYGGTYTTERPSRIATVQVGYGDGYNRLLSNKGFMIVKQGEGSSLAPIVGRVCMDMTMIDVTDLPDVREGSIVLAMGRTDGLHWDAQDIASACGTISYEVLCDYGTRIPRVYKNVQKAADQK